MSALRSTRLRTLSPHSRALLSCMSGGDTSSHLVAHHQQDGHPLIHMCRPESFSTSCCCGTSGTQPTYIPSNSRLGRDREGQRSERGRARGAQPQTVAKVLHKVHLTNWAKDHLGGVLHGIGAYATGAPSRLAEEISRLVRRNRNKPISEKELKKGDKLAAVLPPPEEEASSTVFSKPVKVAQKLEESEREQHTFEKAMEDTHQSITSYHHGRAPEITMYTPLKRDTKIDSEEAVGWSVFRKIPLPFMDSSSSTPKKKPLIRKDFVSRSAIEGRTKALVASLKAAHSHTSKITRMQDLCKHLKIYPSGRHEATQSKVVPMLLQLMQSGDQDLKEEALETLALLGYSAPVKGRGIRILTLDGGGTRGLMAIQCLKKMEEISGRQVHELFDYVCGVSTGALIAAMICLYRLPLEECHRLYVDFSRQMFSRSRVIGTGGLVWNHSFYDSDQWEEILKKEIGHKTMIEFARDDLVPKMSAVSTVINTPHLKNFMFRNYNLPPSTYSQHPGSCIHELWQVIRASSAAPGYYEDFQLGDYIHSDGGLATNNPTALAVHESRLLWPNEKIQCVVSLGTGRFEPTMEMSNISSKVSLKEKVTKIVDSATDTEAVHVIMTDLMPPATYFRFNPYMSEELQLDEIRQDRVDSMLRDTAMYLRKNQPKMEKAVFTLKQERLPHQRLMDHIKLKVDTVL